MDIGTAKPSPAERAKLPHHLIDIRGPDEQFNAGDFVRLAEEAVCDIAKRGMIPVVSGGTGFYLKNFITGLPSAPPSDADIRAGLKAELREKGSAALMEELARVDPESAGRIHINDEYRLLRALEVTRLSGRPLSSFQVPGTIKKSSNYTNKTNTENTESSLIRDNSCSFDDRNLGFRFLVLSLSRPREELYRRINERCAVMFSQGLPDEVRKLYDAGYTPNNPGLRAIGYREFFVEDEGHFRLSKDLPGVQALIAQNSRRYAKRQITFFSSLPQVKPIEAGQNDEETARRLYEAIQMSNDE
jgi:tRNA dimethylallyltransferase